MKKTKIYAAYGSNLNHAQMRGRCPDAKYLGSAMLKDQNLIFCGQADHSFATIETMEGKEVPIGLWEISARDEKALDRYEGYPRLYIKQTLEVRTFDGQRASVMAYIMNPELHLKPALPLKEYYLGIKKGFEQKPKALLYSSKLVLSHLFYHLAGIG